MASIEAAYIRIKIDNRKDWLRKRQKLIQASDAAAICECSPWKDKTEVWDEKKGLVKPRDISDKPYVQYGKEMEQYIRAQFLLDNPYFTCDYHEFDILVSKARPWQGCTLDGELTVVRENPWSLPIGSKGPLECKTGRFRSYEDVKEWSSFPEHYRAQVYHQLSVTGWDFEFSASRIKRDSYGDYNNGFPEIRTLYHLFTRNDPLVEENIKVIEREETAFKVSLDKNERPALTLSF